MPNKKEGSGDQSERFKQAARDLGCDEDAARFEEKLKKVAAHKAAPNEPKEQAKKKPQKL